MIRKLISILVSKRLAPLSLFLIWLWSQKSVKLEVRRDYTTVWSAVCLSTSVEIKGNTSTRWLKTWLLENSPSLKSELQPFRPISSACLFTHCKTPAYQSTQRRLGTQPSTTNLFRRTLSHTGRPSCLSTEVAALITKQPNLLRDSFSH